MSNNKKNFNGKKKKFNEDELNKKIEENKDKIIGREIFERPDTNLIDQYFELQIEFLNKYGENTIVLMQVGSFFEAYSVDNSVEKIGDLKTICDLLNIQLSRRNKNIKEINRSNPYMCGFPCHSLQRFLNILLSENFTIVLIEQTSEPPKPKREITGVYSAGTYIDNIQQVDPNNIVSIYFEENINRNTGASLYCVGLSTIDLSTGNSVVYQKMTDLFDLKAVFDDIYRFIESFNPKEIIFHCDELKTVKKEDIKKQINLVNRIAHFEKSDVDSKFKNIRYQNEFLGKVYPDHGILSPIEYINLERLPQALMSFILLLHYAYEHNDRIIYKIKKPELWNYQDHLILYHNAIYQLNIIPLSNVLIDHSSKYKSLYDVISCTSTPMGKRTLKHFLMNPITDVDELNRRYNRIDEMQNSNKLDEISNKLLEINDIERMHRKMELGILHPHEFGSLNNSYDLINNLLLIVKDNLDISKYCITEEDINEFTRYQNQYLQIFDFNEIHKYNINNIQNSIFKPNNFEEIDVIQNEINEIVTHFDNEGKRFSNYIEPGSEYVKVENTEKNGYSLVFTTNRGNILYSKLSEEEKKKYEIKKHTSSNSRIISKKLEDGSKRLFELREKIQQECKNLYLEIIGNLNNEYSLLLKKITHTVSLIDLVKSCVTCNNKYGYHRPIINDRYNGKSYFSAKKMRHPLIEVIHDGVVYVDNDIELLKGEDDINGILLMGLNGVGKSSMAKAVGCNVVMAQMGMYVPSSEFEYYPYHKIFTRINGDDNIFKGMSSFVVEMNELRSILKFSDNRSLVLGDEVCKGTEEISALAIVSSTIKRFSEREINFIMATHFHKLYELPEIQRLSNVRFKHLSVEVDDINDRIIYGRKLLDGPGDTLYGLEIARFLIRDDLFIKNASEVRKNILKEIDILENLKRSNYNKDLLMDKCMICEKNHKMVTLHTHHILEQHEYNGEKEIENINGVRKDQLANLVVLCEKDHQDVHKNIINIEGWKNTTEGRILIWNRINNNQNNNNSNSNNLKNNNEDDDTISDISDDFNTNISNNTNNTNSNTKILNNNIKKIKNTKSNLEKYDTEILKYITLQYKDLKKTNLDNKEIYSSIQRLVYSNFKKRIAFNIIESICSFDLNDTNNSNNNNSTINTNTFNSNNVNNNVNNNINKTNITNNNIINNDIDINNQINKKNDIDQDQKNIDLINDILNY